MFSQRHKSFSPKFGIHNFESMNAIEGLSKVFRESGSGAFGRIVSLFLLFLSKVGILESLGGGSKGST